MSRGSIHNTKFSWQLMNGSNKLEHLSLASLCSLAFCDILDYWAHVYCTKKKKFVNMSPDFQVQSHRLDSFQNFGTL